MTVSDRTRALQPAGVSLLGTLRRKAPADSLTVTSGRVPDRPVKSNDNVTEVLALNSKYGYNVYGLVQL